MVSAAISRVCNASLLLRGLKSAKGEGCEVMSLALSLQMQLFASTEESQEKASVRQKFDKHRFCLYSIQGKPTVGRDHNHNGNDNGSLKGSSILNLQGDRHFCDNSICMAETSFLVESTLYNFIILFRMPQFLATK